MGKLVDDAKALADAANTLVTEAEAEEGGTVTDKTVTGVTITYSDGSTVDFSPAGNDTPAAPVVPPVTEETTPPADTAAGSSTPDISNSGGGQTPEPTPEGATEIAPTVAGEVPQS